MSRIQYEMKSKIGPLYLIASDQALEAVFWRKQPMALVKNLNPSRFQEKVIIDAVKQLEEYFAGQRREFSIALKFSGTPFQKNVWKELSQIPFGKTVSYKYIAQKIKNPKAVRAVGTANGKNPFCIVIPCHRVIAADGSIGGYSGGLGIKNRLLRLEQTYSQ